ncbi:acetyltransferase [Alginatibacterium sediminis]|uniref:Acetyltransferase n=1 Tax=Alginatibacterium sediminis TaxID=2164068 RepID=A0A420EAT8_9ALTE|nr:acetyltransferase [Alginatibacterium sediminis]RKF17809.1 acetyltransferase [Alginatibacterium sediminis]
MSNLELKPLVIIGGGGHASVLVDILLSQQRTIIAIISPEKNGERSIFEEFKRLSNDIDIHSYDCKEVNLVNGIGMLPKNLLRRRVNQYYLSLGYQFETVVADNAYVSPFARIDKGAQILSGAIIQTGAVVGAHTIANTGSIVEHDCVVGDYNHIGPRATLCGQVLTEENVFVGAGATVIQSVCLAQNCVIGAGATIVRNINRDVVAFSSNSHIEKS